MTKEELISELNVAFKQNGMRSIMLDDEKRLAQGKGILHLCGEASNFDEQVQRMANMVFRDYASRLELMFRYPFEEFV